jgi:UDP-GlcNAc:undecaprenyl-phosphate/decaprenyl-phosphate GlcNAc-1-phosphate transferase
MMTFLLFSVSALIFSFLVFTILLKFATNLGIRGNTEGMVRWAVSQKPSLGGLCFFLIFLISISAYPIIFTSSSFTFSTQLGGFVSAVTLAFLIGLADDAYNTKPLLKLLGQITCGLILLFTGTAIHITDTAWVDNALTILWIVGIMNSINMLDNMDGVAASVAIAILGYGILCSYFAEDLQNIYVFSLGGLAAALTAFLFFNFHPSKIFMGDTGSQLLGVVLAAVGIELMWNHPDMLLQHMPSKKFLTVLLVFVIPLTDTATVFIIRLWRKRSPFIGGRDHTTHSLFFSGITEKRITILYFFLSTIGGGLALWIQAIANWTLVNFTVFALYFLVVFITLFVVTRIRNR